MRASLPTSGQKNEEKGHCTSLRSWPLRAGETRYINYVLNAEKPVRFDYVDGNGRAQAKNCSLGRGGRRGRDRLPEKKGKRPQ